MLGMSIIWRLVGLISAISGVRAIVTNSSNLAVKMAEHPRH